MLLIGKSESNPLPRTEKRRRRQSGQGLRPDATGMLRLSCEARKEHPTLERGETKQVHGAHGVQERHEVQRVHASCGVQGVPGADGGPMTFSTLLNS